MKRLNARELRYWMQGSREVEYQGMESLDARETLWLGSEGNGCQEVEGQNTMERRVSVASNIFV